MSDRKRVVPAVFGLVVACVLAYAPVWHNQFTSYDDNTYITQNRVLHQGLTAETVTWAFKPNDISYWQPLTWLSLLATYEISGLSPLGFHLTNLALHVLCCVALFLLLWRLTDGFWESLCVAGLFALHPLNVESVAWAVERKNTLSGVLFFATLAAHVGYTRRPNTRRYLLVVLLFALGLMAKVTLASLPVLLLVLDFWPLRRLEDLRAARRLVVEKLPLLAMAVAAPALAVWLDHTVQSLADRPMGWRIAEAFVSYVAYLGKMLWPTDLTVFHPPRSELTVTAVAGSLLLLVAITAVALRTWRQRPWLLAGWCWYLVSLLPSIGIIRNGAWPAMAERFVYLPGVGIFIIVAFELMALLKRLARPHLVFACATATLLVILGGVTYQQVALWRDDSTLWRRHMEIYPRSSLAYEKLGTWLFLRGNKQEALRTYEAGLEARPISGSVLNNAAICAMELGNLPKAMAYAEQAAHLPGFAADAFNTLGEIALRQDDPARANAYFMRSLQQDPDHLDRNYNVALSFERMGNIEAACGYYRRFFALASREDDIDAERAHAAEIGCQ